MRRVLYLSLIIMFGLLIILGNGCGSSRQTVEGGGSDMEGSEAEYDEIERLLGITRDEPRARETSDRQVQQQQGQTGEQDDLIRLLEVDEGKPKEQATTTTTAEDKRVTRLQSQVDELQKEVQKKDMEIADLKAQLRTKQEALDKQTTAPTQDTRYYSQPTYAATPGPQVSDSYGEKYQYHLGLFHERRYQEAIAGFEELLAANLNHSLSDNAQYWIGECYYAMGRFREAIMAFEKVFTFPQSNKNDYAQFKIGQCYFKLGDKERSNQEFQQLIDNYPDSELVVRARNYLAQF